MKKKRYAMARRKVGLQKSLMSVLGEGIVGGVGGGAGLLIGRAIAGLTWGSMIGGLASATLLYQNPKYRDLATVVVVNSWMDAVASLGL